MEEGERRNQEGGREHDSSKRAPDIPVTLLDAENILSGRHRII